MNQVHFTAYDNDTRPRGGRSAGVIRFAPESVRLEKIAGGASLNLGYTMHLNPEQHVSIGNVTGELSIQGKQPSSTALGIAIDPENHVIHTGYKFPHGEVESRFQGHLRIPLTLAGVETIERLRDGDVADFRLTVHGSVLIFDAATNSWDACRLQIDGGTAAAIQIKVSRDHWTQQVRGVSPMGSVLVEIPLAVSRDAPWNGVWEQLDKASAHLTQGGEAGWEGCVAKVRQALELRAKIDNVALGPSKADQNQDRRDRLNDVAKALFHYCSLAVHVDRHETRWTRADATLALSTLCALLSIRDP